MLTTFRNPLSIIIPRRHRIRLTITLRGQRPSASFTPWHPLEFDFPTAHSYRLAHAKLRTFLADDRACLDPCLVRKEQLGKRHVELVIPYVGPMLEREQDWAAFLQRVEAFCRSQGWVDVRFGRDGHWRAEGTYWTVPLVSAARARVSLDPFEAPRKAMDEFYGGAVDRKADVDVGGRANIPEILRIGVATESRQARFVID